MSFVIYLIRSPLFKVLSSPELFVSPPSLPTEFSNEGSLFSDAGDGCWFLPSHQTPSHFFVDRDACFEIFSRTPSCLLVISQSTLPPPSYLHARPPLLSTLLPHPEEDVSCFPPITVSRLPRACPYFSALSIRGPYEYYLSDAVRDLFFSSSRFLVCHRPVCLSKGSAFRPRRRSSYFSPEVRTFRYAFREYKSARP